MQNGTQVPDRTEWHNIVLWRGLAETAEKYVHKGDKLYIEGKIRTRSYDDQTGAKRYVTEVFADTMEMLTPKSASVSGNAPFAPQAGATASRNNRYNRRLPLHKITRRTIYRSDCLTKTKIFGPRRLFMPVGRCF